MPRDYQRTVFVDLYSGAIRGTLDTTFGECTLDTFGEWLPVRAWIDELHRTLHLGNFSVGSTANLPRAGSGCLR